MSFDFSFFLSPLTLGYLALGTVSGIVVGAIPGLTGAMLISLALPLTFAMPGEQAMVLLVSMYVGAVSGGLVSATLLRMPGTPAAMMTALDGFPMARDGNARRALGLGVTASLFGGVVSWIFLMALAQLISEVATRLAPFDFLALVLLALALTSSLGGDSALRGLLAGALGILFAMPGVSPATGDIRMTFGFRELDDGFKLLPVLIGLFAVSQVLKEIALGDGGPERLRLTQQKMLPRLREMKRHLINLIRSSLLGTWVGALPGIGANIGSALAYSVAKKFSKQSARFGRGSEEGIMASESANNATVGGALIPLIAMGIPGSVIDAILLGALVIHGLQPGPLLFQQNPEVVHTMMGTVLLSNMLMFLLMIVAIRPLAQINRIPREILLPVILTFCVIGSYALGNRMFDVWVMFCFGLIGFGMERSEIPLAPFVIGFVLAPIAEENLAAGLMLSGGSYWPLMTQPVSAVLLLVSAIFLCRALIVGGKSIQK